MNIIDQYCLASFPELHDFHSAQKLEEASELGSYIFHEDIFSPWVVNNVREEEDLLKVAAYIEYLSSSVNQHMNDLAQIAIIEYLIGHDFIRISPYLGVGGRGVVEKAKSTTDFDATKWLV